MRAVKIWAEPFEFISYVKLECRKELNQHGTLKMTGLIRQEKEAEYMGMAAKETWVSVKAAAETGEEIHFFDGILTGLWVKKENQVSMLTIEVRTGSFLLDIVPHTRSFQDEGMTYAEVMRSCLEESQGSIILLDRKNEQTQRVLMQYNETDWEFLKRLASYAETVLIPEDAVPGRKLYFGYREKAVSDEIHADTCRMEQNYEEYRKKTALGMTGLTPQSAVSYVIRTREIYGLGEQVQFEGRSFMVGATESWLEGQELYHEYRLVTGEWGRLPVIYNRKLSGVSLKATVTGVEHTVVQVQIHEDENKGKCGSRWFDYATVYSTPDGTGWYCMPEIGDEVRTVFPDKDENNAYVASSVHVGSSGGRTNPSEKSWKNKQNKEIRFTPDGIVMTNNDGLLLELSDQNGITMVSDKDIIVRSDGNIEIRSQGGGVHLSAESDILMKQGSAKIHINDAINIVGGKIYMN